MKVLFAYAAANLEVFWNIAAHAFSPLLNDNTISNVLS